MKSTRLFKQAFILATVSSLAFTSATLAMEDFQLEKNSSFTVKSTQTLHEQWEEAKNNKGSFEKFYKIAEEGINTTTSDELELWTRRLGKFKKAFLKTEPTYEDLQDEKLDTLLWKNLCLSKELQEKRELLSYHSQPTFPNNNLLKVGEDVSETTPQILLVEDKKDENITISPQKTSKELWEADASNPTKRFEFVIKGLRSLYENGDLPSVAVKKQKGEWKINVKDVNISVNLTELNKKLSKNQIYDKDASGFKIAIDEIERVFVKKLALDPTKLPDPSGGVWSKQHGLQEKFDFNSKLYYYYVTLGYPGQSEYVDVCVINQIINKINSNEIEYN